MLIKLLVAALVFFFAMFIALIWWLAALKGITLWLPGAITAFFVVVGVGALLFRRFRANSAARGLEKALAVQAKQQARVVRPDLQIEVQRMQEEFDKAVQALKSSKLGARGSDALYFLPWYTIIGPPGAGKSTALRNSGLQFPYTSTTGQASVKGLGGTRNCDWWLTNEAVVLDTAGRWSTQEEDHDEWISFLALLKKYRSKKPLNGIITAISIGDVVNAREDEVEALATRMRERLDEVQAHLRVSIPVYVLFTKCDLVEGFLETFSDLRRSDRGQVWGFTAPLAQDNGEPGEYFCARFDELSETLERVSLGRMPEERSIDRRAKIYAFPQQFMVLRRNLSKFLSVMFQANIYQQTPTMRGVYFTSGTQEGRPFNLLMNRLAEAVGIRRKPEAADNVVDQKSYFLHDVFMKVIFEDRGVASASEAELRRQRVRRLVLTAVLGCVSLLIGIVPSYAFSLNKLQLMHLEAAVQEWEAPEHKKLDDSAKLHRLEPLRQQVNELIEYARTGAPLRMRMGMYQADDLVPHMRRYYANLLRRELVQPLVSHDIAQMSDFGMSYEALPRARPSQEEHTRMYALLRLYLLLSQCKPTPKEQPQGEPNCEPQGEPAFDKTSADWVEAELGARWSSAAGGDKALLDAARTNAALYPAFMQEFSEALPFPRDKEVVKRVRSALSRVPPAERALERLIAQAEPAGYELSLQRMIGSSTAFRDGGKVRSAFTRRGWENLVRDSLAPEILETEGELWVLGTADAAAQEKEQRAVQLTQLRTAYFKAYIEEWQNFLHAQRIDPAPDHAAALALLRELSRGSPPPVSLLIQKVNYNLQLKPKTTASGVGEQLASGTVDAVKKKVKGWLRDEPTKKAKGQLAQYLPGPSDPNVLTEANVPAAFEGFTSFAVPPDTGDDGPRPSVPFDAYQEQLAYVRDALQMYLDDPKQADQLQTKLQEARVKVRSMIDQQQVGWRPLFEALLWPPIEGAAQSTSTAIASAASGSWCNDVYAEFERTIQGRYPFNRDGHDLPLTDFGNFYKPKDGRLWAFVGSVLANTVSLDGDQYVFSKKLGQDGGAVYNPALLDFLERSRDVATSFYPSGAPEPSVEFEVKVQPSPDVAATEFSVGGKSVEHYNGPEKWKTLVWPGERPEAGASIVIRGANGMHEVITQDGGWGLFRLLEAGTLVSGAGRTFTVAWQLQTHDVTLKVDFRLKRGESPFFGVPGHAAQPVFLQPVRIKGATVPRQIMRAGKPCGR
jgi:type VI secretion system protein ImpL